MCHIRHYGIGYFGVCSFQKHFCTLAGVFSVSGILQKYFQSTLKNTIKFCSIE